MYESEALYSVWWAEVLKKSSIGREQKPKTYMHRNTNLNAIEMNISRNAQWGRWKR